VLRRRGRSRLHDLHRTSGQVVRYQREHPGALLHLDVKKLGRIPDGGGHPVHGRAAGQRGWGIGYDCVHSLLDDRSQVASRQLLDDQTGATSARFLVQAAGVFASLGSPSSGVDPTTPRLTPTPSGLWRPPPISASGSSGPAPIGPQTNGKLERFHRRLKDEWAYRRAYPSNAERRQAFEEWLEFYHHRRPHSALHGLTPMAVLVNNVHGNHNQSVFLGLDGELS
jgi:hypothetical protein